MPRYAYLLLPLIGGAMIAAQAPVNARLRVVLGSPVGSALVSFAVGTVLLFGAVVVAGDAGRLGALGGGPWWAYLGGALGAFFVFATLVASPAPGRHHDLRGRHRRPGGAGGPDRPLRVAGRRRGALLVGAPGGPRADVRQPGAAAPVRLDIPRLEESSHEPERLLGRRPGDLLSVGLRGAPDRRGGSRPSGWRAGGWPGSGSCRGRAGRRSSAGRRGSRSASRRPSAHMHRPGAGCAPPAPARPGCGPRPW